MAVNELGLRGLKLHPTVQHFSPADSEMVPLIKQAADSNIPIFVHMMPIQDWGDFNCCLVEHITFLWRMVPEAKILIGHMEFPRWLDLLSIAPLPGVHVETSWGLTAMANLFGVDFVTRFIFAVGVDNVVFDSDWIGTDREMNNQLNLIQGMDFTQEEKDNILGENTRQVLETR